MYLPSRRRMHHCFLTGQGHNVHIWHQSKFTEDANWNKQKWCYSQSKNFSRASDIVIHLRTFRVIFNGMPVLFWSYVGDLATSMGKCFFQFFWPRVTLIRVFFFWKNSLWSVQFFIIKTQIFLKVMVSEEWEQICQFSLKSKATESNSFAISFC